MGSHHHQGAILVPNDKLDCFGQLESFFCLVKNGLAFYPGPVLPPRTNSSSLIMVRNLSVSALNLPEIASLLSIFESVVDGSFIEWHFQGEEENRKQRFEAGRADRDVGTHPPAGARDAEAGRSVEAGIGGEEGRSLVAFDADADGDDDDDVRADHRSVVVAGRREVAAEANVADGFKVLHK